MLPSWEVQNRSSLVAAQGLIADHNTPQTLPTMSRSLLSLWLGGKCFGQTSLHRPDPNLTPCSWTKAISPDLQWACSLRRRRRLKRGIRVLKDDVSYRVITISGRGGEGGQNTMLTVCMHPSELLLTQTWGFVGLNSSFTQCSYVWTCTESTSNHEGKTLASFYMYGLRQAIWPKPVQWSQCRWDLMCFILFSVVQTVSLNEH